MRALVLLPLVEASDAGVPAAAGLRRLARRFLGDAHDLLRFHGDASQFLACGVAQGGDYRRGRGYGRRLAHAFQAVGRFGVGELQYLHPHGGHVQYRGDQVVREGGVLDLALLDLDLLEQGEPEPLRDASLDLTLQRLRVYGLAHVLRCRYLDDPDQTELGVHLHDRPVCRERELQVGIALPILVERLGLTVMELDRLLDLLGADKLCQRHDHPAARDDVAALDREIPPALPELVADLLEDALADSFAGLLDSGAGHVGLARGRSGAGRAHPRVRR